jgi:hypothetical protein
VRVRLIGLAVAVALAVALAVTLTTAPAWADDVRPVQVHITEREPDNFLVQWLVPQVLPIRAMPSPVLPAHCRPEGERVVLERPGAWLNRQAYRCSGGLFGHSLGISYPISNPGLATVIRVDLLSGARFAHALAPTEESWQVPEEDVGAVESWLRGARGAVVSGWEHVVGHWVHIAFLLALILVGGAVGPIRLVTAFAVGQVAAVAITTVVGSQFDATVAEICVAIAVVLLAREALRTTPDRRRVTGLGAGAGVFHGVALAGLLPAVPVSGGTPSWWTLLVLVLGMDAALLVLAAVAQAVERLVTRRWPTERARTALTYVVAVTAVTAALALAFGEPATETPVAVPSARLPGMTGATSAAGPRASRRLAPQAPSAPIQSYLAVEPFEVRQEVLVRVQDVAHQIGMRAGAGGNIEIGVQEEVTSSVAEYVSSHATVEIDGEAASGIVDRVSFMTVDAQGVLPRQSPVREPIGEAFVGVTLVYLTPGVPNEVTLSWDVLADGAPPIPATVIDPESSRSTTLTSEQPVLRWRNELLEDPIPTVAAVAVEPAALPIPLLSLALLALAFLLVATGVRGRRQTTSFAAARVALALALAVGTFAQVAIALPASVARATSAEQAQRILASVLPNVYRALEFRDEGAAYDRLAMSVTGETLTDIYLEHRRSLELEERGGARARVDAVEVKEVGNVRPREDGGFDAEASWIVGGNVTHFGHRHFRQNRYDTRVTVVPVDGTWKIRSIDILEQERVR